ncbi:MAG: divergent polysaccharide deacetylase family protein [Gammaproteobacteria bacterium]|nr:divergent polysaccharide deacetylase family protein [Gammaproteobacteria bacterium]
MSRFLLILSLALHTSTVLADKPILSLVIDDLGYSFEQAKKVINLPGEHTYAIIPHTTYSKRIALYAHQFGRETILHMPMQSALGRKIEASALHDQMSEAEITESVLSMIRQVPHIKGINNHMGSRMTEIDYMMRPVMETIKTLNHSLYFLDSRTTALSKAYQQARIAGLDALKRDVFLDVNHVNSEAITFQYQRWLKKAKDRGQAIAIGHPHPTTIEVLQKKLPDTFARFDFKTLSQLIQFKQQETASWPRYLSHWQQDSKNSKP